ncbi:putative gp21 [Burkholderia pseudomallei MSHR7343]|nr:putative gp21 [Burkholderia pseudomallei MSHR7343]
MRRGAEEQVVLKCKPGDLARINSAWNELLVGGLVLVQVRRPGGKWSVLLLGEPALARRLADGGYVATRRFVADDTSLDPLDDLEARRALAELTARVSLPRLHLERDVALA